MGNDDASDTAYLFDQKFGEERKPTAAETDAFVGTAIDGDFIYVTAWKILDRGAPISQGLKEDAIGALTSEMEEVEETNPMDWEDPKERIAALKSFRDVLVDYPTEGAEVELDEEMGLLDTIYTKMAD